MKLVDDRYVDELSVMLTSETLSPGPEYVWVRPSRWLVAALVGCLVAVLGLGALVYRDGRQDERERRVSEVVTAYLEAWNSHDLTSVLRLMTPYAAVAVGGMPGERAVEHYQGEALVEYLSFFMRDDTGFVVTRTGPITVTQSGSYLLAAVPLHMHFVHDPNQPASEMDCQAMLVLVEREGALQVFRHFYWRCASMPTGRPPG